MLIEHDLIFSWLFNIIPREFILNPEITQGEDMLNPWNIN